MLRAAPYVSLLLAALAALLPSCSLDPKEVGELTVPKLDLPCCSLASPFTLSIDFAGWNACHDMFFLRLQDGGEYATRSDGLDLQLYQL